ncbi:DUF4184 family protein [Catellatospora citrea]|uniref:DUF4184 family protein n=1 Tax=Catellatospora citrea TaxID=53366 RepID=A0A8J3KVV2_9ACTN|nr:DUF4184 family protein [Catellatospora citrea]RKE11671.1 uncharacterized protein DUF4184 [Catellatospora citrea]GIG02190.1 hypothetical protein Cci01nite_72830 [Catellatospora citrea]
MPLTLPTHPVAVVPLKLWRPRWFDGVALTIGAIAPDLAFAADGYGVTIHSHAWHAPLWWALPLTVVGTRLVRWAAPTVAAHLPADGPLALRDYGALGLARHRRQVTVISALIGAASHIGWDAFTHPTVDGGRVLFPFLHRQVWPDMPWWELLSAASNLVGFAAGIAVLVHIGRTRLLRRWYGPGPATTAPRPTLFWSVVTLVFALGLASLPLHPVRLIGDQAVRVILFAALALCAGAAAVRTHAAVQPPGSPGRPVRAVRQGADGVDPATHPMSDTAAGRGQGT